MGLSSTPEEDAELLRMAISEQPPLDWLVLNLPDGRYAAFWRQGLGGEHTTAVVEGDYTACAFVGGSLESVKDYIRREYCEQYRNDRSGSYKAHIDQRRRDFHGWI